MMKDAINEKNVDFRKSFRQQKDLIMAQVIRLVCNQYYLFYLYL